MNQVSKELWHALDMAQAADFVKEKGPWFR